jgi:hypothetical protein
MRRVCGLTLAAIGLSASLASAADITVQDPSFELAGTWGPSGPWASISTAWNTTFFPYSRTNDTNRFSSVPDGTWYANFTDPGNTATQNLLTAVNSGETLAVTFHVGRENGQVGGIITATFMVGSTPYTQDFDATGLAQNTWQSYTLTKTIGNSGNLSLKFSRVSGRPWLDNVSDVTVTPAPPPAGEPTSTSATLTAVEDTEIALAAENFGYSDPNDPPSPLAAVKIIALPAKGTLKNGVATVGSGDLPLTVAVANIPNLSYQAELNGNGTGYTTIGIRVQNSNGKWSVADAAMMVNVTPVNDPPTSAGGAASMKENTVKWFAASNFQFSDVDAGDTLSAIKLISLPGNGILTLNGTEITAVPSDEISVGDIGTLTYTPKPDYSGSDPFKFQVSDGTAFSTDATMAITVTANVPPSSTGGSVSLFLRTESVKSFAAGDFKFSDADSGDTLSAIKVISLPTAGNLKLGETDVSSGAEIPEADTWNLTYTPTAGYTGADSFKFQVSDGTDFSADATMAITVTSDIVVRNGSFETPGGIINATYWRSLGSPWTAGASFGYEELDMRGWEGATFSSAADGFFAANMETWILSATQDLNTPVNAGDTLSVTFSGGRAKGQAGGKFAATFVVGTTEYTSSEFDTALLANDTWQSYTFTTLITNTGNLSIVFRPVSGRPWLDKVSNISVTTGSGPGSSYAAWAATNGAGTQTMEQDHDHDGVPNGIEYFLGGSGNTTGFTALPGVVNTAGTLSVTWSKAASGYTGAYGTDYVVQTSTTLATGDWTNEPSPGGGVTLSGNHVIYTFPSGPVKKFARLKVMGTAP